MDLTPVKVPKSAVQALADHLISMETSAEKIVELIIRMDEANVNVREFGAYLSLADRVYGRMTELVPDSGNP